MIDDRVEAEPLQYDDDELRKLVKHKLPASHAEYSDVFSKEASNQLPPRRACNHKVELTGPNTLTTSPLYHMLLGHLEAMREYHKRQPRQGLH